MSCPACQGVGGPGAQQGGAGPVKRPDEDQGPPNNEQFNQLFQMQGGQ